MIHHVPRKMCPYSQQVSAAIDPSAERSANRGQRLFWNCALWATGRLGSDAAVIIGRRDGGTNVALNRGRAEPLPDAPHKVFQIVAGSGSAASALLIFKRESAESRNRLNVSQISARFFSPGLLRGWPISAVCAFSRWARGRAQPRSRATLSGALS